LPFLTLDWLEPAAEALKKKFDLVIACDVFYDDSHLMNVPRIAVELLKPDGTLLLADPERFRFRTALDLLRKHFSSVTLHNTSIDHTPEEAQSTGVVNPRVLSTSVQIVHCQNPLTPPAG
jgi:predicted nicotinamide N-methyase